MLEIFSIILTLIFIAKYLEDTIKVPFVLIIIILSYIANSFFDLDLLGNNFESIMYLMLPIILIPDVLGLSRSELKENLPSIFYLAIVAVLLSIGLAVGITYMIDDIHHLTLFELLIVFTPLMATDVVSVGAIFSKFKLPQQLKLLAEGESLFNDITAMVIFFFIAIPFIAGQSPSPLELVVTTAYTLFISIFIGAFLGIVGYYSFKVAQDNFSQFIAIYVMASLSFLIADKIDLSGILAVIVAILLFKYLFDKEGHYKQKKYNLIVKHLNTSSSSELSFRSYKKEAYYVGLFANAVIFISIANVVDIDMFFKYETEIIYTFVLTTFIRYLVILTLTTYRGFSFKWTNILTLSGMKGGLALIMIVSLSDEFVYKEMFIAIILGVVILSIFVYTLILMSYLYFEKDAMLLDTAKEKNIILKDVHELLAKESVTGAYNEVVFEDIIEKEIHRAERYNFLFSVIAFKSDVKSLKKIEQVYLRSSDYFGKVEHDVYAVLMTHNTIDGALTYAKKLENVLQHQHIAISQYMPGDSVDAIFDKLHIALQDKKEIDIEV